VIGYDHTFPININTIVPEISQPKEIALNQINENQENTHPAFVCATLYHV